MAATRSSFLSAARTLGALLALALLAGCAGAPPLPAGNADFTLPRQLHVVQAVAGQPPLDALLVVQREGAALRWSLFDPMGVPQARQMLERGQWRNDGFLRPNAGARDLFAALIFAWTPEAELDAAYGAGNWRASREDDGAAQRELLDRGGSRWSVRWPQAAQTGTFIITTADQVTWRISPLKEQP
ncbi:MULTISPECIES: hypothetical protein [Achromobacter]|uniref:Lipoprotein n=1 Tax=Achromobacter aegrifaciens TaxID=1287736 RepID=A0ABU2DIB9_ACHAE|nr:MULTISPECIES: hypothetical protein [Achromobacter]MBD9433397.1 hypothetical protein [Achromobacter sp. ACM03]MDR7947876.1 hypothetical protein [Achromobacter aegrifaciens]